MARYIDPSKIKLTGLTFEDINNEVYFSLSDVRKAIEQTPTADVVEVVRCKDCKYWQQVNAERHACYYHGHEMDYDEYCSYGERKEQE